MKRKIKTSLVLTSVLITVLITASLFFLINSQKVTGMSVVFKPYKTGQDQIVFCSDSGHNPNLSATGGGTLEIKAKKDTSYFVFVLLEGQDGIVFQGNTVIENGKGNIDLGELKAGDYLVSLSLSEEEKTDFFAGGRYGFEHGLALAADTNLTLHTPDPFEYPCDLVINHPFCWETGMVIVDGDLLFESRNEGKMEIKNNSASDFTCDNLICKTPCWDIFVDVPFGNFLEERPFFVHARSLCGRKIDTEEVFADSADDIAYLTDGFGALRIDDHIKKLTVSGDFCLSGFSVARPLSVTFSGNVKITDNIVFDTSEQGKITVDYSKNAIPLGEKLIFDSPSCDVFCTGDEKPEFETVETNFSVRSYNGVFVHRYMGGSGSADVESAVLIDSVTGRTFDTFARGNVLYAELELTDNVDPDKVKIDASFTQEAKSQIIRDNGEYYFVITDTAGSTRGYKIEFYKKDFRLPIIRIETENGAKINTKDRYINAYFSIDYGEDFDFDSIYDSVIGIQGRGHSSWKLEKKPYKIKFESGTSLFGLEKAKRWVLVANHVDRSLIRNQIAYSVGNVLDNMVFIPSAYMVDLYINGEYHGVYQLSEQPEINRGRVPGVEDSTETDTDFLLEIGGEYTKTDFGGNVFSHKLFRFVEIKNPDSDVLTKEQFDYVSGYVKAVEDAVVSGGDYHELLDVPSLVDWFLLYEFSYNLDGIFRRSDYLLKKSDGKLFFCLPWDFDYAFGNMGLDSSDYEEWICLGNSETDSYNMYIPENIMDYLLKDPYFISCLKERWEQVGEKMLSVALETVSAAEVRVAPSAEQNFERWKVLGKKIQFENKVTAKIDTYQGQLDYLTDWINMRYAWMDKNIKKMG